MYLFDTNTVIYYLDGTLPPSASKRVGEIVDAGSYLSVITKIEILGFPFPSDSELEKAETFINGSVVLSIDERVVNKTIQIRRIRKTKLPDAIIAATALVYNYILVSRNLSDFKNTPGLSVIDPFGW